jgi:hypothetical protein
VTEPEKKTRKPRVEKSLHQKMEEALDQEEAKLKALEPKVRAAEDLARSLRGQHTQLTNEINRACKAVGRKDLSDRLPRGEPDR